MTDRLYMLAAPFEDERLGAGSVWFCPHCALLEGALLANPHWAAAIAVHRVAFARPRVEIVSLVGAEEQGLPLLILDQTEPVPEKAYRVGEHLILRGAFEIAAALAARHGGAGPHP